MNASILILGGTTEARQLAERLSEIGRFRLELSMAGRTKAPARQPVPVRSAASAGRRALAVT